MPEWSELVSEEDSLDVWPEPAVARFITYLYEAFGNDASLKVWDMGCGRGRHVVALASLGIDAYASDYSCNAIDITRHALERYGLHATLACSELQDFPFEDDVAFNGIICWNVLQHADLACIRATVGMMTDHVVPGGCVLLAVCSDSLQGNASGEEVEKGSFVLDRGREKGVLHHFFSKDELLDLFDEEHWLFPAFAENIVLYHVLEESLTDPHIFKSTGWLVLARRR